MNRLHLHDSITISSSLTGAGRPADMTVPAHVYTLSSAKPGDSQQLYVEVTSLRAMVGPLPRPVDSINDRVTHRGTEYRIEGPPLGRYRRGRLHHWTINLERVA